MCVSNSFYELILFCLNYLFSSFFCQLFDVSVFVVILLVIFLILGLKIYFEYFLHCTLH